MGPGGSDARDVRHRRSSRVRRCHRSCSPSYRGRCEMTLLRGGTLVWIEAVGRVLELALAALLWPLGRAARWLWNHVRAEQFGEHVVPQPSRETREAPRG